MVHWPHVESLSKLPQVPMRTAQLCLVSSMVNLMFLSTLLICWFGHFFHVQMGNNGWHKGTHGTAVFLSGEVTSVSEARGVQTQVQESRVTEEATWKSSETFRTNKKEVQLPWFNFQLTSPEWLRIFIDVKTLYFWSTSMYQIKILLNQVLKSQWFNDVLL